MIKENSQAMGGSIPCLAQNADGLDLTMTDPFLKLTYRNFFVFKKKETGGI